MAYENSSRCGDLHRCVFLALLIFLFFSPAKVFVQTASYWCRVRAPMSENLQQEFKLKFGGEPNSIDAETLGYSLVNITSIISEINQQIEPSQPIDIKVKAHGEGSFIVHLALLPSELGQLLTPDN